MAYESTQVSDLIENICAKAGETFMNLCTCDQFAQLCNEQANTSYTCVLMSAFFTISTYRCVKEFCFDNWNIIIDCDK